MADYEIVIHLRDSADPTRILLSGIPEHEAEAERQTLIYDLKQARTAEVRAHPVQTKSGFPREPLLLDPHAVTDVDLVEVPAGTD